MSNVATYDLARLGNVYHASSQAGVTLSALSVTATGLILVNPYGSNKNLAVLNVSFGFTTAPAGASVIGIAMSPAISTTAVALTTPLTVQNGLLSGTAPAAQGKACSAATTVGTPVFIRALGGPVAASQINPPYISADIDGTLILVPGTSIQLAYVTTAAVGLASITWAEYTPS